MKKTVVYAIGIAAAIWATTAQASPVLLIDANGRLTGATGVLVNDGLYDVDFVEGTCAEVFGVCDAAHFTFTTENSALAASQALIDQVLLDVPGLGNFDTNMRLTSGCDFDANCWILTPYAIMGSNFLITQAYNQPDLNGPDGAFVHNANGPGVPISGYDARLDSNGTFARWTARVPEPNALTLLGLGVIVYSLKRRRA